MPHFEIHASDVEAAKAFYSGLFGWDFSPMEGGEEMAYHLIEGDQTLFVRRDEVEAQWEWIDAIRTLWEREDIKPKAYGAGSWGPSAAIALAERDGVSWHDE